MSKNISVLLALKDRFTTPIQKATGKTTLLQREIKKADNQVKHFSNNLKKGMVSLAKKTALGVGAVTAGLGVYAKQSIEAAKLQIEQETKLQAVLKNTKGITDEQIEDIKRYAGELQQVGIVGDEVALAGVQQLGSYQLQADTLKKLMVGMNDLIAQTKGLNATTSDAVNIGNMFGKVMSGQIGALSRAGINFTEAQGKILKFGTETEKATVLAEVLKQNVGGVNKAMAETDQGKIKQFSNNWGDTSEEVGKKLLPALARVSAWANNNLPKIQEFMLTAFDKIITAIEKLTPYFSKLAEIISKIWEKNEPLMLAVFDSLSPLIDKVLKGFKILADNWDRLSPIIYTAVGALTLYKGVITYIAFKNLALAKITKIKMAMESAGIVKTNLLTIAQWKYNAALSANPIGLVIGAIAVLVGAIWLLYKNFDKVKKATLKFWESIKRLWASLDRHPIGKVVKFFLKWFTPLGLIIKVTTHIIKNFDKIKGAIFGAWESLKNIALDKLNFLLELGGKIKETFETLKDTLNSIVDIIKNKLSTAMEYVTTPIKKVKEGIGKLAFWRREKEPPRHALGTSYFQGGVTGINEGGRNETAILPAGTKILSHEESKKQSKDMAINLTLNIQGNVIGNREFMEQTGNYIANKIKLQLSNI